MKPLGLGCSMLHTLRFLFVVGLGFAFSTMTLRSLDQKIGIVSSRGM